MSDAGQSTNRLDRIERILEQVAANQGVLQQTVQQNSTAIAELREVTQQNSTAISELREVTQQNSTAIAELREATQQNTIAIAQNNAAIGELRQQLGDSVADLIHTIDYAIDHMEQMISKAFRQGGNGSNPPDQ